MRIAFLTTEFVTESNFAGGLANYLGRVTTALVERGHKVEVFVTSPSPGQLDYRGVLVHRVHPSRLRLRGIHIHGLRLLNVGLASLHLPGLHRTAEALYTSHALEQALRRRSEFVSFDIVQAASYMATPLRATRHPVAPLVMRASSYAPKWTEAYDQKGTLDRVIYDRLEILAIRKCRWRYAPSQLIADYFWKNDRIDVQVVEPPFHLDNIELDSSLAANLAQRGAYAVHFGKIGRLKGSGVLADAVEPLLRSKKDFRLVLAGNIMDSEGRRLVELCETFPDQVIHLGVLPAAQLYPVIERARVVILPSLVDNLPNTCLEAMAMRCIVIGTKGASFEQLITQNSSGFLVEINDPADLRIRIAEAWSLTPEIRSAMGQAAQERIDMLGPDITIPRLESYFQSIVDTECTSRHVGSRVEANPPDRDQTGSMEPHSR